MTAIRNAARSLSFPLLLGGSTGIALAASGRGISAALWFPALLAGAAICIAWLERVLPYDPNWNRSRGDLGVDCLHGVVSGLLTVEVVRFLWLLACLPIAAWLSKTLGSTLWPGEWPAVTQLALAVVASEPLQYCAHRLSHQRDRLWSWHATHHSAERLYWLNTLRDHPLGVALQFSSQFVPLILLGCPERILQAWGLFSSVHGMLQHSNIDLRLGALHWIFSSADLHRWHHSPRVDEANHNYGALLSCCDLAFGTYFLPPRRAPAHPGLADLPQFPRSYLAQLGVPFRWRQIKSGAAAPGAPDASRPAACD